MEDVEADRRDPIRHTMTVRSSVERTFTLFTEGMGEWWPLDLYSRAVSEFEADGVTAEQLEVEPGLGGRVQEHLSDGRALPWAEFTLWEPPHRVVLAWHPHSMPEPPTEIDVRFSDRDEGTLIELEHRGWERLSGDFRRALYDVYVRGWVTTLDRFVAAADRS